MKFLFPAAFVLLAACSTIKPEPQPGTAEHQRWLHEQAREHFYALKAQERARTGSRAPAQVAVRDDATPSNRFSLTVFVREEPVRRSQPKPSRSSRRASSSDTIYEPTEDGRAEQREWELRQAREYAAFETREAKRLGKTPAQLTRDERLWIRARAE